MASINLVVTPRLLMRNLLIVFSFLFALNLITLIVRFGFGYPTARGFVPMFNFDDERNIPTMYSVFLFGLASMNCFLAAKIDQRSSGKWFLLGYVFIFLSIDEFVSIHERLIPIFREVFSASGFFYFAWIIPYFVFVLILFLILFNWLRHLPNSVRNGMLLAAVIFNSGVFLMEGISGWYSDGVPERADAIYYTIVTVEESLEFLGLILFNYILVKYLTNSLDYLQIQFKEKS